MLNDAYNDNRLTKSVSGMIDTSKRFCFALLIIGLLAFLSLSFPSTNLRLGEANKVLYKLVIEYTEIRGIQADLANMPSVLAGTLYQIDVKDGNTTTVHNFKPIDRAVEIYDVAARLSPQKLPNSVRAILSAKPDLLQITYQAADTKLTFIIDQTAIINIIRGYMPRLYILVFSLYSLLGIILYFVIRRFYVAPLNTLTSTLTAFAKDPTTARPPSKALHINKEFQDAATALVDLQRNTITEMRQRDRLADIGEAVAKINHDIRNVLSSATLVADALLNSQDKQVKRTAPHVVRSLEQAVDLCQSMMDYLVAVPDPQLSTFSMRDITNELTDSSKMQITYSGPAKIHADRKMMQRIFLNLARNSINAGATKLHIDIWRAGHLGIIDISDNGHGIPRQQWDGLFQAFKSHGRGGTGLGLAITQDLVAAQGGHVKLSRSNENGTEFRIQLPVEIFQMSDDRHQPSWWPKLNLAS